VFVLSIVTYRKSLVKTFFCLQALHFFCTFQQTHPGLSALAHPQKISKKFFSRARAGGTGCDHGFTGVSSNGFTGFNHVSPKDMTMVSPRFHQIHQGFTGFHLGFTKRYDRGLPNPPGFTWFNRVSPRIYRKYPFDQLATGLTKILP